MTPMKMSEASSVSAHARAKARKIVLRGDVGDRNTLPDLISMPVLGNSDVIRERRSAEDTHIDVHDDVLRDSESISSTTRGVEFSDVPLTVTEREGVGSEPFRFCNS